MQSLSIATPKVRHMWQTQKVSPNSPIARTYFTEHNDHGVFISAQTFSLFGSMGAF